MRDINKYYFSQRKLKLDDGENASEGRKGEIIKLASLSYEYGVLFKDLTFRRLTLRERNIAINMAKYLITEFEVFNKFEEHKKLPLNRLSRVFKLNKKTVEEMADYIIVYTLIYSNPDFCYLQQALLLKEKENESAKEVVELIDVSQDDILKGVAIQSGRKSTIIMTSEGEFLNINNENSIDIGFVASGSLHKGISYYKKHIALAILGVILVCIGGYFFYTRPTSTIVINTTSNIMYTINKGDRVIEAKSPTDKGKELIKNLSPIDKNIDEIVIETLKYAVEKNMYPEEGIIINVSGENLDYSALDQTKEYIKENNIIVYINNNGNEQKL